MAEKVYRTRVAWVDTDAGRRIHFTAVEDEIEVRLSVDSVGTTSFTYVWEISKGGEPYVKGRHTVVRVDGEGRPDPLSDNIRSRLTG